MEGDPQKRKALYDALSGDGYALGTIEEFNSKMENPEKVRALYDGITADGYDVGDFQTFSSKVGPAQTPSTDPFASAPSSAAFGGGGAASAGIPRPAATASPSMQGGGVPPSGSGRIRTSADKRAQSALDAAFSKPIPPPKGMGEAPAIQGPVSDSEYDRMSGMDPRAVQAVYGDFELPDDYGAKPAAGADLSTFKPGSVQATQEALRRKYEEAAPVREWAKSAAELKKWEDEYNELSEEANAHRANRNQMGLNLIEPRIGRAVDMAAKARDKAKASAASAMPLIDRIAKDFLQSPEMLAGKFMREQEDVSVVDTDRVRRYVNDRLADMGLMDSSGRYDTSADPDMSIKHMLTSRLTTEVENRDRSMAAESALKAKIGERRVAMAEDLTKSFVSADAEVQKINESATKYSAEAKAEVGALDNALSSQAASMKAQYEQDASALLAQGERINQAYQAGSISQQQQNQGISEINAKLKEAQEQYNGAVDGMVKSATERVGNINFRWNSKFKQEQEGRVAALERSMEEFEAAFKEKFGEDPKFKNELLRTYNDAWNAQARKEGTNEAKTKAAYDRYMKDAYGVRQMNRFAETFVQGLGGAYKTMGITIGSPDLYDAGVRMENKSILPDRAHGGVKDLLTVAWVESQGRLAGRMFPNIVATGLSAAATAPLGGVGAAGSLARIGATGARWGLTGAVGGGMETIDLAAQMRMDVLDKTGDIVKANKAADRVWDAQTAIWWSYLMEGAPFLKLPFAPKSRILGGVMGYGLEFGQELLFQEGPQQIAEKRIMAEAEGKLKLRDGLTAAYDNFYEGVKDMAKPDITGVSELEKLVVDLSGMGLIGVPGGVSSANQARRAKSDMLKSYAADAVVAKHAELGDAAWLNSVIERHGSDFALELADTFRAAGQLDVIQHLDLRRKIGVVDKARADASALRLTGDQSLAYTALSAKAYEQRRKAAESEDGVVKKVHEAMAAETERTLISLASGKDEKYFTVKYPDGRKVFVTEAEGKAMFADMEFVGTVAILGMGRKGGLEITAHGAGSDVALTGLWEEVVEIQSIMDRDIGAVNKRYGTVVDYTPEGIKVMAKGRPKDQYDAEALLHRLGYNVQGFIPQKSEAPLVEEDLIEELPAKEPEAATPPPIEEAVIEPPLPIRIEGTPLEGIVGGRAVFARGDERIEGDVYLDGRTVVIETPERVYEVGNVDDLSSMTAEDMPLSAVPETISVTEDGGFVYAGADPDIAKGVIVPQGAGLKAIKRGKDGGIKRIVVTDADGNTKNIRGQEAEDLAYRMMLRAVENNQSALTKDDSITEEIDAEHARQTEAASTAKADAPAEKGAGKRDGGGQRADTGKGQVAPIPKQVFGEKPDQDADVSVWSSLSKGSVLTDSSDPNSHWVVVEDTTSKRSGNRVMSLAIVEKEADGTWVAGPPSIIVSIGSDGSLRTDASPRYSYTDADGNRRTAIMQPSAVSIPFGEVIQEDSTTGERFTPQWAKDMSKPKITSGEPSAEAPPVSEEGQVASPGATPSPTSPVRREGEIKQPEQPKKKEDGIEQSDEGVQSGLRAGSNKRGDAIPEVKKSPPPPAQAPPRVPVEDAGEVAPPTDSPGFSTKKAAIAFVQRMNAAGQEWGDVRKQGKTWIASNIGARQAAQNEEFEKRSKDAESASRADSEALSQEFEARQEAFLRQYPEAEADLERVEEKIARGEPLTAKEVAIANENIYRAEGYDFDESGGITKAPKDRKAKGDSVETKEATDERQPAKKKEEPPKTQAGWKREGQKSVEKPTPITDEKNKTIVAYSIPGFEDIPIVAVKAQGGWRPAIKAGDTTMVLGSADSGEGMPSFAAARAWRILEKHGREKVEAMVEKSIKAQEAAKESRAETESVRKVSRSEAASLAKRLTKAIGANVVMDKKEFDEKLSRSRSKNSVGSAPKGFVIGNTVYLNPDEVTLDTPLHEIAGHVLVAQLKNGTAKDRLLYQKIITLSKQAPTPLVNAIKRAYPELKRDSDEFWEEAFATYLGIYQGNLTKAEGVLKEANNNYGYLKRAFDLIKQLFARLADNLGMRPDKIERAKTIGELVAAIGEKAYAGQRISERISDSIPATPKTRSRRIKESRDLLPAIRQPYTLQAFQTKGFEQLRGKQVKRAAIEAALKQQGIKEIEKTIINDTLKFPRFSGPTIDFDDFVANASLRITPLQKIHTSSYASYGKERLGKEGYGDAKTILFNTPGVDHGMTGHFPSDFRRGATEWVMRQAPGTDTWVAIDSAATGMPAEQMQYYIGTAGSKEDVEKWMAEQSQNTESRNVGLFGHVRRWFGGEGKPYYVAELQSDFFQKADDLPALLASKAEKDARKEEMERFGEAVSVLMDAAERKARQTETPVGIDPLDIVQLGSGANREFVSKGRSVLHLLGMPKVVADGSWILKDHWSDKTWGGSFGSYDDAIKWRTEEEERLFGGENYISIFNKDFRDSAPEPLRHALEMAAPLESTKSRQPVVSPPAAQMIASVKTWEKRMLREAIQDAASQGASDIRIPTPNTAAQIEGYPGARRPRGAGDPEAGDMPYQTDEETLAVGDTVEYEGTTHLVLEVNGDEITIAPENDVHFNTHRDLVESHMEGWYDNSGYELKRELKKEAGYGPYTKNQIEAALGKDYSWAVGAITDGMEDAPDKPFDLDAYSTRDENTVIVFDNSKIEDRLASKNWLDAFGAAGTEQEVLDWISKQPLGTNRWEARVVKKGAPSLFGDDGVWVAVLKDAKKNGVDVDHALANAEFIGNKDGADTFIEEKDEEWNDSLEEWAEDNTISLEDALDKVYNLEYESAQNYGPEDLIGGYDYWETNDGYYVMYDGHSESLSQPYVYREAAANRRALEEGATASEERTIDQGEVDLSSFNSTQRTVLSKYMQLATILKKERKHVEVVEDENGYSWLSSPLTQEDAQRPVIAFSKQLSRRPKTTKASEWNAAVKDATELNNLLSKGEKQSILDAADIITDPDGKAEFIRLMNEQMGVTTPPLGTKTNQKKVSKAYLRDELKKAVEAGKRAGIADVAKARKEFVAEVKDLLSKDNLKGSLSDAQARSITARAAGVNPLNPKAVDRFTEYAAKVVGKANYAADLEAAESAKSKLRSAAKRPRIPVNIAEAMRDMSQVDVELLSDPLKYASMAEALLAAASPVKGGKYAMADIDAITDYLASIESEWLRSYGARLAEDFGISDMDGLDAQDIIDAIEGGELDAFADNLEQAKRAALKARMVRAADYTRMGLRDADASWMHPDQKRLFDAMLDADLSMLTPQQLADYIFAADNIIINRSTDGTGAVQAALDGASIAQKTGAVTSKHSIRTDWPTFGFKLGDRAISARDAWRDMMHAVPNAMVRLAGFTRAMGDLTSAIGIADIIIAKTKVDKEVRQMADGLERFLLHQAAKAKRNGRNLDSADSRYMEGIVGLVMQGRKGRSEQRAFEMHKALIEQDIEKNADSSPKEYAIIQRLYDKYVKDAPSIGDVLKAFKKDFPENAAVLDYLIKMGARRADEVLRFERSFRNHAEPRLDNWIPIRFVPRKATPSDAKDAFGADFDGSRGFARLDKSLSKPMQSANLKQRAAEARLPEWGRIDYNARRNTMQAISRNLFDARVSPRWAAVRAMLMRPDAKEVLGGEQNVAYLTDTLADLYEAQTGLGLLDKKFGGEIMDAIASGFKGLSARLGLAGMTQIIQQPSDQLTNAYIMSSAGPGDFIRSMRDVLNAKDNGLGEFLSMGAIGERGELLAGTKWSSALDAEMSRLSKIVETGAGSAVASYLEGMNRKWFKPLAIGDVISASTAWVQFYKKHMAASETPMRTWHGEKEALDGGDEARKAAFAYAEMMTNLTQGPSDPAMFAKWARRSRSGFVNLFRVINNPYGSFPASMRARLEQAASEMRRYGGVADSDPSKASERERFDEAARIMAATSVSSAAFEATKMFITRPLIALMAYGVVKGVHGIVSTFGDDDDEDENLTETLLSMTAAVGHFLHLGAFIDRDMASVFAEADRQYRERRRMGLSYDEEAAARKKRGEAIKVALANYITSMTVSGTMSAIDDATIDNINRMWYWSELLDDAPSVVSPSGKVKKFDDWLKDTENTPLVRYGQGRQDNDWGAASVIRNKFERMFDAAAHAVTSKAAREEMTATRMSYESLKVLKEDSRALRGFVKSMKDAKTEDQRKAVASSFDEWLASRDKDPKKRQALGKAFMDSLKDAEKDPWLYIVKGISDSKYRAAAILSKMEGMSQEEQAVLGAQMRREGVLTPMVAAQMAKLQAEGVAEPAK